METKNNLIAEAYNFYKAGGEPALRIWYAGLTDTDRDEYRCQMQAMLIVITDAFRTFRDAIWPSLTIFMSAINELATTLSEDKH